MISRPWRNLDMSKFKGPKLYCATKGPNSCSKTEVCKSEILPNAKNPISVKRLEIDTN